MGPLLRENRSMHISINIAATDFASGRILEALDRALKGADINPDQIWLEMTERALMNIEDARATLDELRRRGHCIAIDDFGTGYSGLQYLAKLPVGMLKIDKSFIETVGTAAPTSRVTGHIIALARELKLGLVAEGVETDAQATILRNEGVEYAQGWLFSRAIPADEFLAFLKRNATEPARRAGKVASDAA
jgi:sensor c-di-GMP phosphodiesterase-like protein